MKFYQWASLGLAAVLLGGCGGIKAYVPAGNTAGTGNPAQCANLSIGSSSTITVVRDGSTESSFSIANGNLQALQSRAPGDATVTITLVNAPPGVTSVFTPNPITIPLNDLEIINWDLFAGQSVQPGTYTISIRVQEGSCTSVNQQITLTVTNGNQNT
ncbi:hypothetical protein CCB80_07150 [Armatimonadetes bacterium Uphvl-Ar1]|nr:hypothetical protein CCB80_07150 [Armatimonadetes bacterium Uphvl-Ar1]